MKSDDRSPQVNRASRFPVIIDGRKLYAPAKMAAHGFACVSVALPYTYNEQQTCKQ